MASMGNFRRLFGATSAINLAVEKKFEGILPFMEDADEEAKRELHGAIDFVASIEPFAYSKSTPLSPLLEYVLEEAAKLNLEELRSRGQMKKEQPNKFALGFLTANGQVQLLQFLVRHMNARCILEVGSYVGYAAFGMAEAMAPGGKVTAVEIEPYFCEFISRTARDHNHNVEAIEGTALTVLDSLAKDGKKYDFIYVDCVKPEYSDYYKIIMDNDMLERGGMIACDNVIYSGRAMAKEDAAGIALDKFSTMVLEDERVSSVLLPCFDGLLLIQHKK